MRLPAIRILAIVVCIASLFAAAEVDAQCVSLTTLASAYTQDFDTLSNTAASTTNNLTIPGWFMTETGGGARDNEQYAVDTGGSGTGDTYSYGSAGATDRALGGLLSGTLIPVFGACFTNNTGSTVASLDVAYTGEQWRLGTAARTDRIDFQYSLDATFLTTGTWTDVDTLDFATPNTVTTGAKDGNAAAQRTALSTTVGALSIADGATFWIRWTELDATGADDGLAVDDFSLTPQSGVVVVTPTLNINDVTMAEGDAGGTTFTFTVSLTSPANSGGVTFDIGTADGTATTADNDYLANSATGVTIAEGNSGTTFNVTVSGDTTLEPAETFFVNVTNIVGANAGDTQGLGTINNDDAAPPAPEVLIISEYIEGSSFNKVLEIYNTSTAAVDLAANAYQIEVYFNGSTTPAQTVLLTGTIGPGDVFVISHPSASATILAAADQTSGAINFNGDDAVILRRGALVTDPVVDSLGQVGFDPGSEWGTGLTSTADNTIRRKATICTGDTNPTDVFDPAVEYDGFAQDTFDGLGFHTAFCGAGPTVIINDVTQVEGNAGVSSFTFTVSLTVPAEMGGVTFDIATADGTALVADNDYVAKMLTGQTITEGNSTYMFTVDVNGDTTVEANETFFVNVTNIIGANPGDTQGIGTIQNDDVTLIPIHTIQGSGAASPLVGADVTTSGIVTGLKNNGFFIQTPDAAVDADAATSQGIFVFTSTTPTVAVGDEAQVSGTVVEFVPSADPQQPPLTEISSPTVVVLNSGNPLPAPVVLDATFPSPSGGHDQLERVEGMRVTVPSMTVVAPTQGNINEPNATVTSTGVFFGVVTGVARPFREPGIQDPDVPPSGSIPPIPRWDHNPELIRVDSDGLTGTSPVDVGTGQTIAGVTGPLDFGFRYYTVLPEATLLPAGTTTATPVSTPAANEFTVASYNLQRFFDTVNDPIGDPVLTPAAFDARLNKASLAIRNFLLAPDILGVQEVENLSTLQALAARINADAVAALQPNPQYVAYLAEGNDVGGIDVGFLVKTAPVTGGAPRVTVNAVVQENANEMWNSPPELLNDRPPLRLDAIINTSTGETFPVTVINNHLRSLIGVEENTATGDRVRRKRHAQAVSLANLVQARQIANPAERIILVGDFNAFEFNDGYADVINTILGTPTPDDQTVVPGDGVDVVNPDLVNLVTTAPAGERYSFTFDGSAQNLDHVIINQALIASATSYRLEHARIDADFPQVLYQDGTIAQRLSDHDPSVAFFTIAGTPPPAAADLSVTVTANPPLAVPGQNVTFTVTVTNAGPSDATNVVVTDQLPAGTTFVSAVPSQGSCSGTGPVTCSVGTLLNGGNATIVITVTLPASGGPFTNTATAVSDQQDLNGASGSDTVTLITSAAIPTLSEWALLLLAMTLAGFAVMRIRS